MKRIVQIGFLLLLFLACSTVKPTKEQKKEFAKHQKTIRENWEAFNQMFLAQPAPDSALLLFTDLKDLTFKRIIKKHHLTKEDLPLFLVSMQISAKLLEALNSIDQKIKNINQLDFPSMDTTISPFKFNPSNYINSNDSVPLKIIIAAYDSTGIVPDSLFKKDE